MTLSAEYWRREAKKWQDAVIDALVCAHIYTREHDIDPKKAVHDLICWEVSVALDPRVSKKARDLIEQGRREAFAFKGE